MAMGTDHLKILYGFMLLVMLASLAVVIALGKVEQSTSYGLLPIITALATLSGAFAQWAFGSGNQGNQGNQPKPPESEDKQP